MPGVSEKLAKALAKPAKTRRGKRIIEKRGPLVHENDKNCVFLRSRTTPQVQMLMSDLKDIRKPLLVNLQRRQENLHPFENCEPIEYLGKKNECSLFCLGSSSKKRPFRMVDEKKTKLILKTRFIFSRNKLNFQFLFNHFTK